MAKTKIVNLVLEGGKVKSLYTLLFMAQIKCYNFSLWQKLAKKHLKLI
jgi:hypothetical protein